MPGSEHWVKFRKINVKITDTINSMGIAGLSCHIVGKMKMM